MIRKTAIVLALALALPTTALVARDKPIEQRQALMKEVSESTKTVGDMVKGERPYDADEAVAALSVINAHAELFPTLFPEGSEIGFDTEAAPEIWSDFEGFEARAVQLAEDAAAAQVAASEGLDAFRPAFVDMADNCKACHDAYRVDR